MKKKLTMLLGIYLNALAFILPRTAGRQGFLLFCRPFCMPLKDYHKKFLNTAEHFSFDHDGIAVQGYRWGNGKKKILFIHGWQSHSFRWKAYIEAFSKEDYTLYAIDAPGHGLSGGNFISVPYYTGVIQQLIGTIGPLHAVISHSLGSFSSLYTFYEQPSLPVNKLVLMASPGEAYDFIIFYQQTLKLSDKTIGLVLDHFKKSFGQPITFFSTPRFATAVHVPCLIVHDEEDPDTSFQYSVRIHQAIAKSRLMKTKGIGHNLKSPLVVTEVVNFVNEHQLIVSGKEKISENS